MKTNRVKSIGSPQYDCGHLCLMHQGFRRPPGSGPLTAADIIRLTGVDAANWACMVEEMSSLAKGRALLMVLCDGPIHHWISLRDGLVFDPSDGASLTITGVEQRYGDRISFALDLTDQQIQPTRRSP